MAETKVVKVTKRGRYEQLKAIPAVAENAELVAFIEHELELLAKKNVNKNGEKKLTATQKINEQYKQNIIDVMTNEPNRLFTITELWKILVEMYPEIEFSNQKVSALVRQLKEDLVVERIADKGKALFRLAETE